MQTLELQIVTTDKLNIGVRRWIDGPHGMGVSEQQLGYVRGGVRSHDPGRDTSILHRLVT